MVEIWCDLGVGDFRITGYGRVRNWKRKKRKPKVRGRRCIGS